MFNLKEFITKNIVNGVKNGTWSKEYACIMSVNYLAKGILSEEDVAGIDNQITAWEEAKIEQESAEEPAEEEVMEVVGEETEPAEQKTVPEETGTENKETEEKTTEP